MKEGNFFSALVLIIITQVLSYIYFENQFRKLKELLENKTEYLKTLGDKPALMDFFFSLRHCRKELLKEFLQNISSAESVEQVRELAGKYFEKSDWQK